jgi:hypothetical protein
MKYASCVLLLARATSSDIVSLVAVAVGQSNVVVDLLCV